MTPRYLFLGGGLLLAALLVFLLWPGDPRARLENEMRDLAERATQGEHVALTQRCSRSVHARAEALDVPLAAIARQIRHRDRGQGAVYQFVELVSFDPDQGDAEVRLTRATNNGQRESFVLPVTLEEGEWKLHDRFRHRQLQPRDLPFRP